MMDFASLAIVLHVCLTAEPDKCTYHFIPVDTPSPQQCMMASPPLIARWLDEHPQYVLKRWTCKPKGLEQDI